MFPRFYFLSDDDLLDILARSKDPEAMQRHMNKCFDAIQNVNITKLKDNQVELISMVSNENEKVPFKYPIRFRS